MQLREGIMMMKQQCISRSNMIVLLCFTVASIALLGSKQVDAFSGAPPSSRSVMTCASNQCRYFLQPKQQLRPPTSIAMSLEDEPEQMKSETEKDETTNVVDSMVNDEEEQSAEEEVPEEEDPEIKALKEEIASLETTLKEVRRKLAYTTDLADDFTKTGYARKVAEMENMRRARSMLQSSNKFSATAATLTEFLPILDDLVALKEKYAEDEFGKQYNALPGAMKNAFTQMGVTEFTVQPGEKVDTSRMEIVESIYSADCAKDTVVRPESMGMELSGNVVRKASCVASLGLEITVEEREVEEETTTPEQENPSSDDETTAENSAEPMEK